MIRKIIGMAEDIDPVLAFVMGLVILSVSFHVWEGFEGPDGKTFLSFLFAFVVVSLLLPVLLMLVVMMGKIPFVRGLYALFHIFVTTHRKVVMRVLLCLIPAGIPGPHLRRYHWTRFVCIC